jgi:hypothetical protein
MPNLFLAAVHYLLLEGNGHDLATYYPSITKNYQEALPFELFKAFCLDHQKEIIAIEQSKMVQTNALNRSAYLMPILSSLFEGKQVNLIDIGTSAGLTLNFDKYEYYYNDKYYYGNSPVKIKSAIKAGTKPPFKQMVTLNKKIGIDQNPLDLKESDNANWLKALVWADRLERLEKIEAAITIANQEDIQFIKASTLKEFEFIFQNQAEHLPLVIYHTHTLYQFTPTERAAFRDLLDQIGANRDLIYLAAEHHKVFDTDYGMNGVLVVLTQYRKGEKTNRVVAVTNGHADWIKWK